MTREEMQGIVERILEIDPKAKAVHLRTPARRAVRANAPITAESLARLRAALGFDLPPSYITLLSIHDGIENFKWVDGELWSSGKLVENPGHDSDYELPDLFFFILGEDWEGVAFDTATVGADGEMQVVEHDSTGEIDRWPSLPDFLEYYLGWLEDVYAKAQADQAGLEDD